MKRLEISGAVRFICVVRRQRVHTPTIHRLLHPKRNFTLVSTLTYTSATKHMKINIFKKLKVYFIPKMVTRQE